MTSGIFINITFPSRNLTIIMNPFRRGTKLIASPTCTELGFYKPAQTGKLSRKGHLPFRGEKKPLPDELSTRKRRRECRQQKRQYSFSPFPSDRYADLSCSIMHTTSTFFLSISYFLSIFFKKYKLFPFYKYTGEKFSLAMFSSKIAFRPNEIIIQKDEN